MGKKGLGRYLIVANSQDQWELLEQVFKVPVEKRTEWLLAKVRKGKAHIIGVTDKTAPELATECLKRGIRAKSFVKGPPK